MPVSVKIKPRPRVMIARGLRENPDAKPAELARMLGLHTETVRGLLPLVRRGYKNGPLDIR